MNWTPSEVGLNAHTHMIEAIEQGRLLISIPCNNTEVEGAGTAERLDDAAG